MDYKWYVGIDVSKKTLDLVLFDKVLGKKSPHCQVSNNIKGFRTIPKWLKEQNAVMKDSLFCMEHTGVYCIEIANYLNGKAGYCIESPIHIKRSLGLTRGKNDKVDAFNISRFCYLHRDELIPAKLPAETMVIMKSLINERERLIKSRAIDKGIITEKQYEANKACIQRAKKRVSLMTEDIEQIEQEIIETIGKDSTIEHSYNLITSVSGIGLVNAVMFILYTNNFITINNPRKYACYSGVAPFEHTSGISIKGRTRVSSLANKRIKVYLTNGARSAIIHDAEMRLYYQRKRDEGKEHGTVMNAVKFKLITRVFATVKRGTPYVKLRQAG